MRKSTDIAALRRIATVRDLQCVAAQSDAARAAAARDAKDEALAASEKQRAAAEHDWRAAILSPVMPVDTLPLWSSALLAREGDARRAGLDADAAQAELDRRRADWLAATQRHDIAKDLVRKSVKERQRDREERALQDAADLHVSRRAGA